jgi:hypothetical protein
MPNQGKIARTIMSIDLILLEHSVSFFVCIYTYCTNHSIPFFPNSFTSFYLSTSSFSHDLHNYISSTLLLSHINSWNLSCATNCMHSSKQTILLKCYTTRTIMTFNNINLFVPLARLTQPMCSSSPTSLLCEISVSLPS